MGATTSWCSQTPLPVAGSVRVVYQTSVRPGFPSQRGAGYRSAAPSVARGKRKLPRKGSRPVVTGKRRVPSPTRSPSSYSVYGSTVSEASGRAGETDFQPSSTRRRPSRVKEMR